MSKYKTCRRCKSSLPTTSFVGVRGGSVQTCSDCRAQLRRGSTLTTPNSPHSSSARHNSSRLSSPFSTPSAHSAANPGAVASASSVAALEQRVEQRLDHLGSQVSELLNAFRASRVSPPSPPAPASWPALPTPLQAPPYLSQAHSTAAAPALPSAVQPDTAGELPFLSISRCFAWIPADIVALVERDQLRPEQLVKLRNPESRVSQEPVRSTNLNVEDGQLRVCEESADSRTSTFVKAIPSIAALAQVWLVYVAIRARHTNSWDLNDALLSHLEQLVEFNQLYTWRAVADYHLAVCRLRFGTGAVTEWSHYDPQIAGRVLLPFQKTSQPSSSSNRIEVGPGSRSLPFSHQRPPRQPHTGSGAAPDPCRKFNSGF
ncbi:uncharacterized protein UTRI_05172 [Ustilago trichophora]|uniref:Uncharacterized protein n=1 Tax=Ustilago trichophora TaxID=86804 RepID=A0A5C3EFS9_9BASI|nr:uncharacterized protein UTRI_05172 [Ustilago trichophora]